MVIRFHFEIELNGNFVHLLYFVIESFYCMTLGYVMFVLFVRFVYMVQKDQVDRKNLIVFFIF